MPNLSIAKDFSYQIDWQNGPFRLFFSFWAKKSAKGICARARVSQTAMSNHRLLKVEISQLTIAERIQLAEDLWDSILDRQDELKLNLAQHHQDPHAGSSWETVKQRLDVSQWIIIICIYLANNLADKFSEAFHTFLDGFQIGGIGNADMVVRPKG